MLLLMQDDDFGLCKIYNLKVTSKLTCDSDDHNAKHVYASKDTQAKFQTWMFNISKVFTQS